MEQPFCFDDKVVIVTGGAAGIGSGLVRAILSQNARHVAYLDVAQREGEVLERELMNIFDSLKVMFIKCDVANETQLNSAFKKVLNKFYRIDLVINNAAIITAEETSYKRMVDVNFTAVISSTMMALATMGIDKGGSGGVIINISSMLALKPNMHLPVYSATKAAVLQFTNNIATDDLYSKSQVRMMTVCLGPTDTALLYKQISEHFENGCTRCIVSRAAESQRVESAVNGIMDVIKKAENGSTWVIASNEPPVDITVSVKRGLPILCNEC